MTPEQMIMWKALDIDAAWGEKEQPVVTADNVDELYEELVENDAHWDALSEIREGQYETGLDCDYSRHYESKSVAAIMPDGSCVGWTYWFGGGKHGEPGAIEWMDDAYILNVKEEEKVVTVRTFSKV